MNEPVAYWNGEWVPASAARVHVTDAGFVLGTTVAEQVRTFGGLLFRLDDHLERLMHSLAFLGLEPQIRRDQLARLGEEIVQQNYRLLSPGDDLGLSIVVTPGGYPTFGDLGLAKPTLCLHTYPLPFSFWADKYRTGQRLVTTDVQQVPEKCWPPGLKCRSRMHYFLADRQARNRDPEARALLLDAEGFVTEASTANILMYTEDEGLVSPPSNKILPGISLATATQLARDLGIPVGERDLTTDDIASADEVLLTSTSICVLPVTGFNGRPIGKGRPGKIAASILEAWSRQVGLDIVRQAERMGRRDRSD